MSNKTKSVYLIFAFSGEKSLKGIQGLDTLVGDGNTQLLVLKNQSVENDKSLFNAFSSLSQLEGELLGKDNKDDQPSVIEKNFFKNSSDYKFNDLFHNGGLTSTALYSNVKEVLEQGQKFGIKVIDKEVTKEELESQISQTQLTICYLKDSPDSLINDLCKVLKEKESEISSNVIVYPVQIKKTHLLPNQENDILSSIIPKQTYLNFGNQTLDFDRDICQNRAALVIEHDLDYMRIDQYKSYQEIEETLKISDGNPFVYKYCLADSYMKQIAFKMGKLEKFGA